jgi:hypothetical protein
MVILVLGVVLSSTYAIAVRTLQAVQLQQERTYALKLAEGQLERLKAAAIKNPAVLTGGTGFCLKQDLAKQGLGTSPTTTMDADTYNNYESAGCIQDPVPGAGCDTYCYHYGIRPLGSNTYLATVRWDGPAGRKQQIEIAYRIYP